MTPNPLSIAVDSKASEAKMVLSQKGIKHLPVVEANGRLVGMLSDRDIKLHQAVSDDPDFHANANVVDLMVKFPYSVSPDTSAAEVARHMHKEKIGSVVIIEQDKPIGIFTTMDACKVLADLLG